MATKPETARVDIATPSPHGDIATPSPYGDIASPSPHGDIAMMSFEDALAELDRIVRNLEAGQQKLEDAIQAYERGSLLRRHCEAKLAAVEQRVQAIMAHADGSLTLRPMAER